MSRYTEKYSRYDDYASGGHRNDRQGPRSYRGQRGGRQQSYRGREGGQQGFASHSRAPFSKGSQGNSRKWGNCSFYLKIGACRHGNRCSRVHNPVTHSLTVLLPHIYENPLTAHKAAYEIDPSQGKNSYFDVARTEEQLSEKYNVEEFYVDLFEELSKYGEVENLVLSANLCDHLVGNVYVKYFIEKDAEKAVRRVNGRFYNGRMVKAMLTPVNDFDEAKCRSYHERAAAEQGRRGAKGCQRQGDCNFLHEMPINPSLVQELIKNQQYFGKRSNQEKLGAGHVSMEKQTTGAGGESGSEITESSASVFEEDKKPKGPGLKSEALVEAEETSKSTSPPAEESQAEKETARAEETSKSASPPVEESQAEKETAEAGETKATDPQAVPKT